MPYAPTVNNNAGQIFANGLNNTLTQFAQDMDTRRENERKRRIAAGQIEGFLQANPQLASKVDAGMMEKLNTGKASLNDTLQLLGTFSTAQQQEMEKQQQQQRAQQLALMQQQVAEAQRRQQIAAQNAQALPKAFESPTASAIQGGAKFEDLVNNDVPAARSSQDAMDRFIRAGGTPDQGTNQFFNVRSDLEAKNDATAARAASNEALAGYRAQQLGVAEDRAKVAQERADVAKQRAESAGRHPMMMEIEAMEKAGDITHEEAVSMKKEIAKKAGEFSPNGLAAMMSLLGLGGAGTGAAPNAATASPLAPAAPAAPAVQRPTTGAPQTQDDLVRAVQSGQMTLEAAKAYAKSKGWK